MIFGAPYRPAVTNQKIAQTQPVVIMQTALGDLDGQGAIASYGPPYNNGTGSVQSIAGFSPQTWWGTPYQFNTAKNNVLTPLSMLAKASQNTGLATALKQYENAPAATQQKWDQNMTNALNKATINNGQVGISTGDYGPVQQMMNSELSLASSGLLSGALERETNQGPYGWNNQNDLLFLQGTALHQVAGQLDMKGEQWGINHAQHIDLTYGVPILLFWIWTTGNIWASARQAWRRQRAQAPSGSLAVTASFVICTSYNVIPFERVTDSVGK